MTAKHGFFTPATFSFLRDLSENNTREWYQSRKSDFEAHVKVPTLAFVAALKPLMAKVGSRIDVDPAPVGGSMSRMNRDTRFSKDKSPYKTNVGLMFGHEGAGDLMLGYHLSIQPGAVRAYAGLWEPDGATLEKIRTRMLTKPDEWTKAVGAGFRKEFVFDGESLKRPPKVGGCAIDEDHPLIDDLKRKSFAAYTTFSDKEACSPDFLKAYVESVKAGSPLMAFLCKSLGLAF